MAAFVTKNINLQVFYEIATAININVQIMIKQLQNNYERHENADAVIGGQTYSIHVAGRLKEHYQSKVFEQ